MKRPLKCVTAALLVLFGFALLAASVHAQSTFVYTNNNGIPNTVTGFSVGPGGTLIMVPDSPMLTGGNGTGGNYASNTATVTIRKKILYVSNDGTDNISGFSINTTTGALTPVPGSPFATGGSGSIFGISLAVTPNGKFVYAGNGGSLNISAFSVGSNGALTPITGSPFFIGDLPDGIKVSPNGKFLGVALPVTDSVAMFRIGSNGALASVPDSPFPQGGTGGEDGATYVDMSCNSKQLFAAIGNLTKTEVGVSTIASSGALSPIAGSPFTFVPGVNSNVGILSPKNQWLFVSNQDSNTITSLDVEANGGLAQVSSSPFLNAGTHPSGMATNAEGTLLYVANDDNTVTGFSIDNSNGSLSAVPDSPFPTGAVGLLRSLTTFPAKRVEGEGDENGDDGHNGHFRFEAERECQASSGMDFEETDSGRGMKGSVNAYTAVGNTATITGAGTLLDGTPVHYTAIVLGNAPVIGANRFAISWVTSTGSVFHTSGALTDGYIVVHAQ
jgi:6-phosphogluconolactonase (cycloisomerase 2 family)